MDEAEGNSPGGHGLGARLGGRHGPGAAARHQALPEDEAGRCRYAAQHMIDVGRLAVADARSRPERRDKRRRLVEEWEARLEQGEDPCRVYADIQRAATTF